MKQTAIPANKCMFKVNNRNTGTGCEICLKLTKRYQNDIKDKCLYCKL